MRRYDMIICGDGASSVTLLYAMAKVVGAPLSVAIVGRSPVLGRGTAYATRCPAHVLNAPAGEMSADADDPLSFVRWLQGRGAATTNVTTNGDAVFALRDDYGSYLGALAERAATRISNGLLRIEHVRTEALGLLRRQNDWIVTTPGAALHAGVVVLATGNDMPAPIAGTFGPEVRLFVIDNPWGPLEVRRDAPVLLLGSGLTAVDALLLLREHGHRGEIILLSRRGWFPCEHIAAELCAPLPTPFPATASGLVRAIRKHLGPDPSPARVQGFMRAMRPHWRRAWELLAAAEKRRFIRHGATLWSVHRHRMPPSVASQIRGLIGHGVTVMRGRVRRISLDDDGMLAVDIARAGTRSRLKVARVVNCTGPNTDPDKTLDRFLLNILQSRLARPGPAGIGLDVDSTHRVTAPDGTTHKTLFAMGALTRGKWWEITAITEIARQAAEIAASVSQPLRATEATKVAVSGRMDLPRARKP